MDWVVLVLVGFSSTSSLAFASLAPWRETLCWRSLVAPEFLSLTERRKDAKGDGSTKDCPRVFIGCTSHLTAWPPPRPQGFGWGVGVGGSDRAYRAGWIDDCRVMIVNF